MEVREAERSETRDWRAVMVFSAETSWDSRVARWEEMEVSWKETELCSVRK